MRLWFFTWRTYGTWLPGEDGFVGYHRPRPGQHVKFNEFNTPTADSQPRLAEYAASIMKGTRMELTPEQAISVLAQLQETAAFRSWRLDAVAVLTTHVHVVFAAPEGCDPSDMLRDWKSYVSRRLNATFGRAEPRWWAEGGSMRLLPTDERHDDAIAYVGDQPGALLKWKR